MRALAIMVLCLCGLCAWAEEVRLGFLGLDPDPRYNADRAYARVALAPLGDAVEGARLAVEDMAIITDARGMSVVLDSARAAPQALLETARRLVADGATALVLDLPAEQVAEVAEGLGESGPLLLNATAPEDWLRRRCYPRLLHTAASDRMIADALMQHLIAQKWTKVLMLTGKTPRDEARSAAFRQAAERMRVRVVEERPFDLSTNPALREQNNVRLLTGGTRDYDVIFIADEDGEFSRYVPYRTALPRPVIGATGLVALEWHWALERYGAPQVNSRFEGESTGGRRMTWQDWSAWVAVRAVLTAHAKAREPGLAGAEAYLRSDRLRLDGSKGVPMNFRPWSGQLRMPILLATQNAVIDIAPENGFLHATNTLDTLGQDQAEFACD